jgi:membrane protease subunit HflK
MDRSPGWRARFGALFNDNPKGPWGGGRGSGDGGASGDGGPRNPWSVPPGGPRPRHGASSTLDEFLKRARGGGGPGSGGGGPRFPSGRNARNLWIAGAGLILAVWLIFTSVHSITPQERGVVTTFGRYSNTLEPGIHLTAPSPFSAVQKVDVQRTRTDDFPAGSAATENLMLTGDQNIVDLAYSVRWNIADPQDYAFQIKEPDATVRATAESAMRAVVATVTLDQAIGAGRTVIEARVQELLQTILDDYNSGVRILGIAISKSDPPAAVNDDFKAVSAAQQEAQANLNNARAYAQQVIARAGGEAAQFDKIYEQYRLSPEVTKRRLYYETMEGVLAKSDKTIVEAPGVTPYLPLPNAARAAPEPNTGAATPAPVQQGAPR